MGGKLHYLHVHLTLRDLFVQALQPGRFPDLSAKGLLRNGTEHPLYSGLKAGLAVVGGSRLSPRTDLKQVRTSSPDRLYSCTEAARKLPLKTQRQFRRTFIERVLSAMEGHARFVPL